MLDSMTPEIDPQVISSQLDSQRGTPGTSTEYRYGRFSCHFVNHDSRV